MNSSIYAFFASLPALPDPDRAQTLPISRVQLDKRLSMLDAHERNVLHVFEMLAHLFFAPCRLKKEPMHKIWHRAHTMTRSLDRLHEVVERMRITTLILAKTRQLNYGLPTLDTVSVDADMAYRFAHRSDQPLFGLAQRHNWLKPLYEALLDEHPAVLQHRTERLFFDEARRLIATVPFTLEGAAGYLLGWQIVHYRLASDEAAAKVRIESMLKELAHEPHES